MEDIDLDTMLPIYVSFYAAAGAGGRPSLLLGGGRWHSQVVFEAAVTRKLLRQIVKCSSIDGSLQWPGGRGQARRTSHHCDHPGP